MEPLHPQERGVLPESESLASALSASAAKGGLRGPRILKGGTMRTLLRFARVLGQPADPNALVCDAHRALARRASVQSQVLLRNESGTLPLDPARVRRLAVIGRLAATNIAL